MTPLIAITANTSWYLYNFRKNTIRALLSSGYQVVAIAPKDKYSVKLEQLGCRFCNISIDAGGTNPFNDLGTFITFLRLHSTLKPVACLNFTPKNNIYSTLAGWVCGLPCINNIAGLGILFIHESFPSRIAKVLYRFSQSKAKKLFFQNEEDRKLFLDNNMAAAELTERLPGSGADLSHFRLSPSVDDGTVRFLLVARMLYDKGIQQYVDAARILKKKYKNCEFQLLGFLDVNNPSAVSRTTMNEWVAEGVVNYLGVSDSVELEISKVDCMVLPSYYREGVPKSLLEAGAMGKPIITTDNVGCRETVDDGINGFLCEPRSTEDLVAKLEKMILMSHEERLAMGRKSREKVEREFDEQIVIQKYLDAVDQVLA